MTLMKSMLAAAGMMAALTLAAPGPAMAQESSYKSGSIWVSSRIKVMPGQF